MASDIRKYKKFIVVDEDNKPMSFQDDQFCYCTSDYWQDEHWPVQIYDRKTAKRLIRKSDHYRTKRGFELTTYRLMPVAE